MSWVFCIGSTQSSKLNSITKGVVRRIFTFVGSINSSYYSFGTIPLYSCVGPKFQKSLNLCHFMNIKSLNETLAADGVVRWKIMSNNYCVTTLHSLNPCAPFCLTEMDGARVCCVCVWWVNMLAGLFATDDTHNNKHVNGRWAYGDEKKPFGFV